MLKKRTSSMQKARSANDSNELGLELYWRFTGDAVEAAPDQAGVFAFFDEDGQHILLGSAQKSLHTVLRDHWKGLEGRSTCGAAYVGLEVHVDPLKREAEVAEQYQRRFGKKPKRQAG